MKKYISRYKNGDWLYTIILISCIIAYIIIQILLIIDYHLVFLGL